MLHKREREQAAAMLSELDAGGARQRGVHAVHVPDELADVLRRILAVASRGGTVVVGSLPGELTTTVAAEQLGISRPTLMKLIRDGELPAHKVGTHHRVKTADVLAHRRARLERQRSALDELRALEDELDTI
jgi:excisionase family DNA binding protein